MWQIHHSQSHVEVCEAVIKDRLYLFTVSSHDDNNIQSDHSLFSKEHHSISSSSNPDVHLSSSIVSAKCQYPTLNFACHLGLRTPLPRQSQRLWLTRDHRQDFFLSMNQLSLEILVVYCPFSLDSCLQGSDRRHAILEDHSQVAQLLQGGMNTSDSMWNSTFPWSNVVLHLVLLLGAVKPHMDTIPVSL